MDYRAQSVSARYNTITIPYFYPQQIHVGHPIVGTARILPVHVHAVEFVLAQKLDGLVHELVHAEHVRRQLLERRRAERPAADGQQNLNVRIVVANLDEFVVVLRIVVVRLGELVIFERGKRVNEMRAEFRVNVAGLEFASARPLGRPAGQVAEDLTGSGCMETNCTVLNNQLNVTS